MREEIKKILQMVFDHKVTAGQGEQLLEAMGVFEMQLPSLKGRAKARNLRIKVDSADGDKVNVKLPVGMIRAGVGLAAALGGEQAVALKGIDINQVLTLAEQMVAEGESGELITVDSADGDKVLIVLE